MLEQKLALFTDREAKQAQMPSPAMHACKIDALQSSSIGWHVMATVFMWPLCEAACAMLPGGRVPHQQHV